MCNLVRTVFHLLAFATAVCNVGAGDDVWWSLAPLQSPHVPAAEDPRIPVVSGIDHFIVKKHQEHGLRMSPKANRRVLIRRLYFNLIGLPPTPKEIKQFVDDPNPDAYRHLVDRLLDSDHYGERWARHWLDVVHFGETHGYDKDKPRPNAWPYRDYVIRAFNEDKPYARFVSEQLAGDILWPDTVDGNVATGFIAAGPWDFIGHAEVPEEKIDGKVARHLDRDDMVTTTMNTFVSLTVQCAQCHDHLADPVTMEDYYSLQAVFAALDRADREYDTDPEVAQQRAQLKQEITTKNGEIATLESEIDSRKPDKIRSLETELAEVEKQLENASGDAANRLGYHSQVASSQDTTKWVQVDLGDVVPIDKVILIGAKEYGFDDFGFPHRFRLESAQDENLTESTGILEDHESADFPPTRCHAYNRRRQRGPCPLRSRYCLPALVTPHERGRNIERLDLRSRRNDGRVRRLAHHAKRGHLPRQH